MISAPSVFLSLAADFRNPETTTDLSREHVRELRVAGHRLHGPVRGIAPEGMSPAFAFQIAAVET